MTRGSSVPGDPMVPHASVVHAAHVLSGALALLSILHFYWVFGGTWGLAASLGQEHVEPSAALRFGAGAVAVALAVAAAGVLGRIGLWGRFLPWTLFSWGTWLLVAGLRLGAALNFTARTWTERLAFAPTALALGVLAVVVARSPRP